jgi:hypothetical protein
MPGTDDHWRMVVAPGDHLSLNTSAPTGEHRPSSTPYLRGIARMGVARARSLMDFFRGRAAADRWPRRHGARRGTRLQDPCPRRGHLHPQPAVRAQRRRGERARRDHPGPEDRPEILILRARRIWVAASRVRAGRRAGWPPMAAARPDQPRAAAAPRLSCGDVLARRARIAEPDFPW